MTNNDIKYFDAMDLRKFLEQLPRRKRIRFVDLVVFDLKIHRQTFANWKAMSCRIPSHAKSTMERIAGEIIFRLP